MSAVSDSQILEYVAANIDSFHENRLAKLNNLKLDDLVSRKNPYLFKSKNIVTVSDLVQSMLNAYLSSQEEGLFGEFLEGLAVFVADKVHGGLKSGITGIDLEFVKNGARYIISIKSGPNWGNKSQIDKMKDNFTAARRTIRQGNANVNVVAVNGCCYGRDAKRDKGDYFKICGQEFWELISGDRDFYQRIIEPLGHNAKQRNDDFADRYGTVINRFSREFDQQFCDHAGAINWNKLVSVSSAITPFVSRPIDKRGVNRLPTAASICDVLRYWEETGLANRLEDLMDEDQAVTLASARGFLMFFGAVRTDGKIALARSEEGLIIAEWEFADERSATITFLDVDRVAVAANNVEGNSVRIRNATRVSRGVATRRLIEHELFTRLIDG